MLPEADPLSGGATLATMTNTNTRNQMSNEVYLSPEFESILRRTDELFTSGRGGAIFRLPNPESIADETPSVPTDGSEVAEANKRCPSCGEVKNLSEFGKNRARADGLQGVVSVLSCRV